MNQTDMILHDTHLKCIDELQLAVFDMGKEIIILKKHIVKLEKKVYGYSLKFAETKK